jgi:hypothetical protein
MQGMIYSDGPMPLAVTVVKRRRRVVMEWSGAWSDLKTRVCCDLMVSFIIDGIEMPLDLVEWGVIGMLGL